MKRPWSGQLEKSSEEERPDFDPTNPLCPGLGLFITYQIQKGVDL
jgi:galactose-1-phosphate uridylyltransferase